MTTLTTSALEEKLNDLCAAIVADEEVASARQQAEAFLADGIPFLRLRCLKNHLEGSS